MNPDCVTIAECGILSYFRKVFWCFFVLNSWCGVSMDENDTAILSGFALFGGVSVRA